ncbi:MAG: hypothetical protein IKB02_07445 [Clostridia bacterium]|nr:hypothetical protein [Clostridia bacterium]
MEHEEIRKRFFYEGVELASFVGRYPSKAEYPNVSDFYGELTKSSFEWFSGELCETLRAKYEADGDSKKRFRQEVCHYEANFYLTKEETHLAVKCDVSLKVGKKRVLARFSETHLWDSEGKLMIRPRKEKTNKKRRAR